MFDEKTILARLQNGEDAQKIADEMAAMINAANRTYEEQKAEEARKTNDIQKKKDLQMILDDLAVWFGAYYNVDEAVWAEITADEVLELIDSCQGYIKAINDLASVLTDKKVETKPVKVIKTKDADEILNAFLKRQGW